MSTGIEVEALVKKRGDRAIVDGVSFAIDLEGPRAVHPVESGGAPVHFYVLRLQLPAAPPFDLPFTVQAGGW